MLRQNLKTKLNIMYKLLNCSRWLALLIVVLWTSDCSTVVQKRDDPLIGKIVRAADQAEISYDQLLADALKSEVIYLGENHDNAEHHQIQLKIINDLISKGKRPQIGFEFFSVDQTPYLMSFATATKSKMPGHGAEVLEKTLRTQLGWQQRTDQYWKFYFQFMELAKKHELKIFGTDLPAGLVKRLTRSGNSSLTGAEKTLISPTGFQEDSYRQLMFEKFKASHCGFAREAFQEKMYQTWIARNDRMAQSIVSMVTDDVTEPIVMILGGGHTQHNMAVYERVNFLKPGIAQFNLGLREITIDPLPLSDYIQTTKIGQTVFAPSHPYVWFTQRTSYEDPCRRFKKQLQRMKDSHAK